jgi:hypothetical protein
MTTPVGQESSISYGAYPFSYANGLQIANDATTPNTVLTVGSGVTIDSTDTFQMINNGVISINAATNGLNGLDTGTFAAAKVYAVYLVSDPVTLQPIGAMISLSLTAPLMPFSYSAFRLIGFATTAAGGATFLPGYWTTGNSGFRLFMYDAPLATAVTAGHATTFTNVNLIAAVPNLNDVPVLVYTSYVPATAGNVLELQAGNATSYQAKVTGQVATVAVTTTSLVLAQTVSLTSVLSPVINYLESNVSDAVAIDVAGYYWTI